MKPLAFLLPVLAGFLLTSSATLAEDTAEEEESAPANPYLVTATRILVQSGLTPLPQDAKEMQCYAWSGLSAGIYAAFTLKKPAFEAYLAPYAGMERASPIPRQLLAPPNSAAPWFGPGGIADGTVFFRGRISRGAPELFRLYADPENLKIFLYYTWNNKRIYP
jgi:hypothetical protein